MSTDVGNGDYGTAENDDAPTLNSDAETALQNPPPGTTAQKVNYLSCMGYRVRGDRPELREHPGSGEGDDGCLDVQGQGGRRGGRLRRLVSR